MVDTAAQNDLSPAMAEIAVRFAPIEMPLLKVAVIDGFLALVPAEPISQVNVLAEACMVQLDCFRAPQTEAEYERRQPEGLSGRQRALLRAWGYPYVLEEFRWHMTLTDRADGQMAASLLRHLKEAYRRTCGNEPVVIDCLSLLHQPALDMPFQLVARIPLRASGLQITH